MIPKNQVKFFLFLLILVFSNNCSAGEYSIIAAGKIIECSKFTVTEDEISCNQDHFIYTYQKNVIEGIAYKGIKIYPYTYDEEKILSSIKMHDCNKVIKHLYGPLYIDKVEKANKFVGAMYDFGCCVLQDYSNALTYYKKSDLSSEPFFSKRVKEIERYFADKEKEAVRQRVLSAEYEEKRLKEEIARKQEEVRKKAAKKQEEAEKDVQQQLVDAAVQEYNKVSRKAIEKIDKTKESSLEKNEVPSEARTAVDLYLKGMLGYNTKEGKKLISDNSWFQWSKIPIILKHETLSEQMFDTDFSSIRGYQRILKAEIQNEDGNKLEKSLIVIAYPGAEDKIWKVLICSRGSDIENEIAYGKKNIGDVKFKRDQINYRFLAYWYAAAGRLKDSKEMYLKAADLNRKDPDDIISQNDFDLAVETIALIMRKGDSRNEASVRSINEEKPISDQTNMKPSKPSVKPDEWLRKCLDNSEVLAEFASITIKLKYINQPNELYDKQIEYSKLFKQNTYTQLEARCQNSVWVDKPNEHEALNAIANIIIDISRAESDTGYQYIVLNRCQSSEYPIDIFQECSREIERLERNFIRRYQ